MTRRTFGTALAATPALLAQQPPAATPAQNPGQAAALNPQQQNRQGTLPEVPPFDDPENPIEFKRNPVAPKVQPFALTQVRLLPGPFQEAAEWNRGYMERLPVGRLIHNFRVNADIPSTAKPFGGWEQPNNGQPLHRESELRGHFTGHYLTASAQQWASTGDKTAKAKGDEMVAELAKCQKNLKGGYLSAFPIEFFERLDARKVVWAPFYTVHKIMAGMLDMYTLAGNKQALEVVTGMANWADQWSGSKTPEHMQSILNTEYGGMNEVLYNIAAATGDDKFAVAGDRFTKKRFFNPLAMRRDEMRGLHVNTHIPQVIGAAVRYEMTGDYRFHDVADYFWYEVVGARSYVTTGTSNGEGWLAQPRQLAAELKRAVSSQECCCSYNMLKLTRHLYEWTADPRYFDYYERSMLNMRLGTIQPKTGYTQYYLSLTPGAWKTFNTEDQSFWCCTGSGVEEYSKLGNSIYWHDGVGLYVNLFIASEAKWVERGVPMKIRQETTFPETPRTALVLTAEKPVTMPLRLRIPAWADGASVKVNGRALESSASPGSYVTISRTWKTGDRVELELPMRLTVESMPDDRGLQAFLYGPLVLAGDLGTQGLTPQVIVGPNSPRIRTVGQIEIPTFKAAGKDPSSWIKPAGQPLTFRTTGQAKDVTLSPINSIFDKRYSVYFQVS